MLSVIMFPSLADEDEGPLVWNTYTCALSPRLDSTSNWAHTLSLSSNWPLDCLVSSCLQQKDMRHVPMHLSVDPKAPQSLHHLALGPPGWPGLPPDVLFRETYLAQSYGCFNTRLSSCLSYFLPSLAWCSPVVTRWHACSRLLRLLAPQTHGPLWPVVPAPAAGTKGTQTPVIYLQLLALQPPYTRAE